MKNTKTLSERCACAVVLAAGLAVMLGGKASGEPIALENATVITCKDGAGFTIEKGTLVIDGGKIVSVGAGVAVPAGAKRIDCTGKVIMPGLVDTHSHIGGAAGADSSGPIQPDVRILDSINPRDSGFRRAVAGGLTTINVMPGSGHLLSGQTIYLKLRKPAGKDDSPGRIEEWCFAKEDGSVMGGMKMANGTNSIGNPPFPGTRGKSAALVREQYIRAQEYAEGRTRWLAKPEAERGDPPGRELAMEGLGECLRGERIVQHHTHRADDIMTVLRMAEEFKFRVVLHHTSEAWKVADEIAKADTGWGSKGIKGTPVSAIVVDSPGGKLEAADMSHATGAILEKAGVTVAFHTDDWITDSRLFLRSAALSVRAGMTREGALKALTINGAMMLDLEKRVGTLEAGKDADFVILSGDPLSVYTHVEQTWVEGTKVFDRSVAEDRLMATGGFGAGREQQPYLCCVGGAVGSGGGGFTFNGKQWGNGNATGNSGSDAQAGGGQ